MQYLFTFLEGIIAFISPCLLPMLPIYLSYFAGGSEKSKGKTLVGTFGFILGFTFVFIALGALAGTLGSFITKYRFWVDLVCGVIVIFFGLNYMGLIKFSLFRGESRAAKPGAGFFPALLFGALFSVTWTPCIGPSLGAALAQASQQGSMVKGVLLLLCYSAGLGIPFVLSAILIDRLKSLFDWIKRHYDVINKVCGAFLILVGILMATGLLGRFLTLLS